MKTIFAFFVVLLFMNACQKPSAVNPAHPEMQYTDFNDKEISFNQHYSTDLNNDGIKDFSIYTLLVGDPQSKTDYQQYYFGSALYTDFPINNNEEIPMLNKGAVINGQAFTGCKWWPVSDIIMAQKVITLNKTPYWKGNWQNASHNYLPLRIYTGNDIFYGWVEVSFDRINEKVILHHAAVCKEKGKEIFAGF